MRTTKNNLDERFFLIHEDGFGVGKEGALTGNVAPAALEVLLRLSCFGGAPNSRTGEGDQQRAGKDKQGEGGEEDVATTALHWLAKKKFLVDGAIAKGEVNHHG